MKISSTEDIEPAIDEIEEYLGAPITRACEFYSLYYLTEQKGVDELGFDFFKVKDKLSDTLYNYSAYVLYREFMHVKDQFEINIKDNENDVSRRQPYLISVRPIDEIAESGWSNINDKFAIEGVKIAAIERMKEQINENLSGDAAANALEMLTEPGFYLEGGAVFAQPDEIMETSIKNAGAFVNDDAFLDVMQFVFGNDWRSVPSSRIPETPYTLTFRGWTQNYGGDAWAKVAESTKEYFNMSDEAFIDLMFSIEHNNGNFLDKVPSKHKDDIRNLEITDLSRTHLLNNIEPNEIIKQILPLYLDLAREGDIAPLYDIAKHSLPEIRGYKHLMPEQEKVPIIEGENRMQTATLRDIDVVGEI